MKQIRQFMLIAVCMVAVAMWAQQSQPSQPAQGDDHQHMGMGQGQGHGHGMGQGMDPEQHFQMMSQKLNLTDEQKAKIKPIFDQHMKDRQAIMSDQSLTVDQKHAKMKESMDATHSRIEAILTPEQKKQFAQMMQDMHGDHKGMGMHDHKGGHDHGQSKDDSSPK